MGPGSGFAWPVERWEDENRAGTMVLPISVPGGYWGDGQAPSGKSLGAPRPNTSRDYSSLRLTDTPSRMGRIMVYGLGASMSSLRECQPPRTHAVSGEVVLTNVSGMPAHPHGSYWASASHRYKNPGCRQVRQIVRVVPVSQKKRRTSRTWQRTMFQHGTVRARSKTSLTVLVGQRTLSP